MSEQQAVTEQDVQNALSMLNLLARQVQADRVEKDYALRQITRISDLVKRLGSTQHEQKSAQRFEALFNVSRIMGTSLDLETVLRQVMDAVVQLTRAERGFLMLRDDDGEIKVEVARNLDQQTLSSEEFAFSRTITNYVLDKGEAVLTTNAQDDPRFQGHESIVRQSLRSIMATPLLARGRVLGVAYVDNHIKEGLFRDEDLETLDAFANQAAFAIDNALLFEETDEMLARRVEELRMLRRIDMQLNANLDEDTAFRYTLETVCRTAEASIGYLGIYDDAEERAPIVQCYPDDSENAPQYLHEVFPQIQELLQDENTHLEETPSGAMMVIPVRQEHVVIGAMALLKEDGEKFTPEAQDLAERITARAAIAIENARLYARVQAANKAKSEFVGIVAHDLKAPMTSIKGYADLLLMLGDKDFTEDQKRYLDNIRRTVGRMTMLVSDLSDIVRIESGQFLMTETEVVLQRVVDDIRDTIVPELRQRNHTYVEEIEPDLPNLFTDYYRLMQVLTNLLSNAYKYTPNGGTITFRAKRVGDRVRFEVQDTGIGLTPEGVAKLGTRYWRAEDEYTRSQPGTGLGFTITARLIEQMGSEVEIESEVGKGSTFAFSVLIAK